MKAVVIGGHSRNIGKTSLMAGLIGAFDRLDRHSLDEKPKYFVRK